MDGLLKKEVYSTPRNTQISSIRKSEFKKTNAQAYASIKAIIMDLREEKRELCMKIMEDQGF
jgi:hypothetical protein